MKDLTDQQKGSLLAFVAVMFITPDSLFIRLSNIDTWGLVFYRGIIPFLTVFFGMLIIYKLNFFKILLKSGYHGFIYVVTFSITNITFAAIIYIFFDSLKLGNFYGDILGFITAIGLAVGAVTIRSAKSKNLVPAAVVGKLLVATFALLFIESFALLDNDLIIVPLMCIL